jgi:hypothetical protein
MLIQYLCGAGAALLVELALGPGAAEPRAIGLGLAAGLVALHALPEPLEIDYFPHARFPRQKKNRREATIPGVRVVSKADVLNGETALVNSFILNRPVNRNPAPTKN